MYLTLGNRDNLVNITHIHNVLVIQTWWWFVFLFFFFPRIMSTGNLFVCDRMQALFPVLFSLASLWQTYLFISFIISGYIKRFMQLSWSIYIWASKAKFLFKTWKKKKNHKKKKKAKPVLNLRILEPEDKVACKADFVLKAMIRR